MKGQIGGRFNAPTGGRGRMGRFGLGPSGYCVCPSCGTRVYHGAGDPCYLKACPKCGGPMTRDR